MNEEPWIETLEAAEHVGYKPTATRSARAARRLFYKFVRRHRLRRHYRGGRLVFRRSELDRAIEGCTDAHEQAQPRNRFTRMDTLARRHANG